MVRPFFAPEAGTDPHRSLVLAGGGMRVAYQAGVLQALGEVGLRFGHADGASGGTMNLAMMLGGQAPAEMCERWRSLDPKGFASPLAWRQYVRSPHWPALGGSQGVVDKVFPHLGIDAARVRRAEGMVGTFNVCNFSRKTAEVVEHTDVDPEMLLAAISLPVLMPAVRRQGQDYTDAVWIRDSNVAEAVRRGSDEIWLIWCIGNVSRYTNGAFRQYVHMIEMSANGSLFADFDRVKAGRTGEDRPLRLHVIKPEIPLPLDPDYYFGRIDAATLIDLGYQDAYRYLDRMTDRGVAWDPEATRMSEPSPGGAFRTTLSGPFALGMTEPAAGAAKGQAGDGRLTLQISLDVGSDALVETAAQAELRGHISVSGLGDRLLLRQGSAILRDSKGPRERDPSELRAAFAADGEDYVLTGAVARAPSGSPALAVTLRRAGIGAVVGAGILPLGWSQVREVARTLHATNAPTLREKLRADLRLGRTVIGATRGARS